MAPEVLAILTEVWSTSSDPEITEVVLGAARAGDVNGDGVDDLLVVEFEGYYIQPAGYVRIRFGAKDGVGRQPDWFSSIDQWNNGWFASVVAVPAGDVNGDGFADVLFALPFAHNPGINALLVVLGTPLGLAHTPIWTLEGPADSPFYTPVVSSIASAGDVNGDGFDDVLVGAWWEGQQIAYGGFARLYLGSPTGPSPTASWTASGVQEHAAFGRAVASAGDVNGDGFDDVAVGSSCDISGFATGRVDVYLGSASGPSATQDWSAQSNVWQYADCTELGNNVASAGDVNGDGFDDLIVGAPYDSSPGELWTHEGTVSVFYGSPVGLASTPSWFAVGDQLDARFGHSVASAGDVDGDGFDDIVIGSSYHSDQSLFEGRTFLYRGGPAGLATSPAWFASGDGADTYFGSAVGSAGDVNGDHLDDLWVYALGYYEGNNTQGRVSLYVGSDDCTTGPDSDGDGRIDACDLCVGDDLSQDADGDGWCALTLEGEMLDCDETDADAHPENAEVCDGADSDCVGGVSDDEQDLDGDGVFPCGGDCDGADPAVHPYTDEICGDGVDNNCDGAVDESCSSPDDGGCGCATPRPSAPWALFAFWAALLYRRRA